MSAEATYRVAIENYSDRPNCPDDKKDWQAIRNLDVTEERWLFFDLDIRYIDPNFVKWLESQGIQMRWYYGQNRGAIAQSVDKLCGYIKRPCHTNDIPSIGADDRFDGSNLSFYVEQAKSTKIRRNKEHDKNMGTCLD